MLTRRWFLRVLGAGAGAAALPPLWGCGDNVLVPATHLFFTPHQWDTIDAATAIVLPPGTAGLGAHELGAVAYIDGLLAAFDVTPPRIFAGGPASGRQPEPDAHGLPTQSFPPDAMTTFLPLSRVREIAWRMRVFGSAATDGGTFNDALLGPTVGWRDLYTDAVTRLDAAAAAQTPGARFVDLGPAARASALAQVSSDVPAFGDALIEHTLEGAFAVPEYGGNANLGGWQLAHYDGDSVPLGHAVYDESADAYVDNPAQPTSTPSPGATSEDFDSDILDILTVAAVGSGGKRFF